jgi:hypothetical protein
LSATLSEHPSLDAGAAMRCHDDEIDRVIARLVEDLVRRRPHLDSYPNRHVVPRRARCERA